MVPRMLLNSSSLYLKEAHPHSVPRGTFIVNKTFMVSRMILNPIQQPTSQKYSPHSVTRAISICVKSVWKLGEIVHRKRQSLATVYHTHTHCHTRFFVGAKARLDTAKVKAEPKQLVNTTHCLLWNHTISLRHFAIGTLWFSGLEGRLDGAKDDVERKQPISKSGSPTLGHTRNFHCRQDLHGVKDDIESNPATYK